MSTADAKARAELAESGLHVHTHARDWLPVGVVVAALLLVREVLPPFVIGAVLAYLLLPLVRRMVTSFRLPRALCVVLIFVPALALVGALLTWVGSLAAVELTRLVHDVPSLVERSLDDLTGGRREILGQPIDLRAAKDAVQGEVGRLAASGFEKALLVVQTVVSTVVDTLVAVMAGAYLTISGDRLLEGFVQLLPTGLRETARLRLLACNEMLGRYLRGQLLLVAFMSACTWVGLHFYFHMPYALVLALASGLLEIIPLAGPMLAIGLNAFVGFSVLSWGQLGLLVAFFIVLRQLEDQLVIPLVVGETLGLHPAVGMLSVLGGAHLAGPLGMILAVPVVAASRVLLLGPPQEESRTARRWTWRARAAKLGPAPPAPEQAAREAPAEGL